MTHVREMNITESSVPSSVHVALFPVKIIAYKSVFNF